MVLAFVTSLRFFQQRYRL